MKLFLTIFRTKIEISCYAETVRFAPVPCPRSPLDSAVSRLLPQPLTSVTLFSAVQRQAVTSQPVCRQIQNINNTVIFLTNPHTFVPQNIVQINESSGLLNQSVQEGTLTCLPIWHYFLCGKPYYWRLVWWDMTVHYSHVLKDRTPRSLYIGSPNDE